MLSLQNSAAHHGEASAEAGGAGESTNCHSPHFIFMGYLAKGPWACHSVAHAEMWPDAGSAQALRRYQALDARMQADPRLVNAK